MVKFVRLFNDFTPLLACAMPAWKMIIKRTQKLNRFVRGKSQNDTRNKSIRKVIGFAIARNPDSPLFASLEKWTHDFRCRASPKGCALWLAPPGASPGRFLRRSNRPSAGLFRISSLGPCLPPKGAKTVSNVHDRERAAEKRPGATEREGRPMQSDARPYRT